MSAIAGLVHLDGSPASRELVAEMLEIVKYRGPDGRAVWARGPAAIGHALLATTPEAVGKPQPVVFEKEGLVLTFHGRIDNREELLPALRDLPEIDRSSSDAEMVLGSYALWGTKAPSRLLGDFAFAVWDQKARLLFCCRDPLGVKPFYYRFDNRRFIFASDLRQLLCDPDYRREPNELMMGMYLAGIFPEREQTLYRNILRLPPGHSLMLDQTGLRKWQYWKFRPADGNAKLTDNECAERYRELLLRAVCDRLRSAARVGILVSGGLDSSAVFAAAAKSCAAAALPPQTAIDPHSVEFSNPAWDQRQVVQSLARHFGTQPRFFRPEERLEDFDLPVPERYQELAYTPTIFMFKQAFDDASARGISVMLAGFGGDDTLTPRLSYLGRSLTDLEIGSLVTGVRRASQVYDRRILEILANELLKPMLPRSLRRLARRVFPLRHAEWLTPEYVRKTGLWDLLYSFRPGQKFSDPVRQGLYARLLEGGEYPLCFEENDRFASASGMELSCPLFDLRMIEFVLSVPAEVLLPNSRLKPLLRAATEGLLPDWLRFHPNAADFTPFCHAIYRGALREKISSWLGNSALVSYGIVDKRRAQASWELYCSGKRDDLWWRLEGLVNLERWVRACLERRLS